MQVLGRGCAQRRLGATAVVAAVAASVSFVVLAATGVAAGSADCVAKKEAAGISHSVAVAECLREGGATVTTLRPSTTPTSADHDDPPVVTVVSGDSGSSTGVVVAVGVVGLLIGAAGGMLLARRRAPSAVAGMSPPLASASASMSTGFSSAPPPTGAPLPPQPGFVPVGAPPPSGPAVGSAPPVDRSSALVETLVDLSDRVGSQALRAEILSTLARADVHTIDVPVGTPFDVARMRGVESTPAPDPSWTGRVAATERDGFREGQRVLRLPDVVVYTAPN